MMDVNEQQLLEQLRSDSGDQFARIFSEFKDRLRRIVRFRIDYRLASRISDSDIIQECYVRAANRLEKFLENPEFPFFVWLRMQANQQVADLHRKHLLAEKRDARRELRLPPQMESSNQTSIQLAAYLVAQMSSLSGLLQRSLEIRALENSLN